MTIVRPVARVGLARSALDLASTLASGQVFRWRRHGDGWVGVVGRAAWLVQQDDAGLTVASVGAPVAEDDVRRFFRLDVDLSALAAQFASRHPMLREAVARFPGLRVVRQPPADALISFACSSANHVARIARSLDALARAFGDPIGSLVGEDWHALPTWEQLANADPVALWRNADLGYRGRVLHRLGVALATRPAGWLESLADAPYPDARRELTALPGIGPKIADCVCLYAFGHDDAAPIDSHIWAVARALFPDDALTRTLTDRAYQAIGDRFRATFAPRPGWAQHYLFHQRRVTLRAAS
ncbi:MAG: hypothetical protein NZ518_00515 [Dehalococcoidia bacterium]|nr:hypothetical protein [Dehalococcoidia bacterium]